MIKINLIAQPKKFQIPVILGLDIRMFNFKMLFIAWIISYLPNAIKAVYFDLERAKVDKKMAVHRMQIKKYNKILKRNRNIKRKIEEFAKQAEKLKRREEQVREIIRQRTNPFKILVKLANSIPQKVWCEEVKIESPDIKIVGYSVDYRSIGIFLDSLNDSIYFSKSLRLQKTESLKQNYNGEERRIEQFILEGEIVRFD